jgi:SAM-dependent methyltransferase
VNEFVNRVASPRVRSGIKSLLWRTRLVFFPSAKRPFKAGETLKARQRRLKEDFFDRYCVGKGIDIGYGGDPISDSCDVWESEHGDAQYLQGLEDWKYDFVYSSHTLEHMQDAGVALVNWWRLLKPGGFLILYIPDRDLYEKKTTLPSGWNEDHKTFFLLDRDESPDTIGVLPLISRSLRGFEIEYAKRCGEGCTIMDPLAHSDGEYSIEVVIRKLR